MQTYQLQLFNYAQPKPRLFQVEDMTAVDDENAKAKALERFDALLKAQRPDRPKLERFKLYNAGQRLIDEMTDKQRRTAVARPCARCARAAAAKPAARV